MTETRRTTCNRDCPDACTILVDVDDGGRATRLRGDHSDVITRGFLCERTNKFLLRQYAPDRFLQPMLRRDGELCPVTWDDALDLVAEKLLRIRQESGPAAILHYRSGGSLGLLTTVSDHLFEQFGPVTIKRGDICSGAGDRAQELDFGICDSHDVADLRNSRLILLWGKNPHVSGPHLLPVLNDARRNGAHVIAIDPVRTRSAQLSDRFLQPRPGADYAVAMALARRLFDTGGVDPQAHQYCDHLDGFRRLANEHTLPEWAAIADVPVLELEATADALARIKPASILIGWGLGRRRNGARTTRAIDALGAITGNLGVPGGGVSFNFARQAAFDRPARGETAAPRTFAEARLGHEILAATDPPVRAIWVTAGNPISMLPDSASIKEAFGRAELTVVVDTHPTDTTDCADVVLPTLTLLEDDDIMGAYGNHYLRASSPAIAPPPGPRHELHILQGLAERIGVGDQLAGSVDDWKRRYMRRLGDEGIDLERLRQGAVRNPFAAEVPFAGRKFPTSSGRVNLLTEVAEPAPLVDAEWPLTLLATSTAKAQSSQWAEGPPRELEARVHPTASGGFADGETARLESRHGSLEVVVRHDEKVRPDVAMLPKGGMLRDGQCANLLITAVETDDGGGAAYYDETVRLVAR